MNLFISNLTHQSIEEFKSSYSKLLKKTLETVGFNSNVVLSVTFVSIKKIREINRDYRNIDRPTDVISFAYLDDKSEIVNVDDNNCFPTDIGELYICYKVAEKNAKKYGNSLSRELNFLFVHGLLHLLGYDHMTKEDEEVMFGLQDDILPSKEIL